MFDHEDEDHDLDQQVHKGAASSDDEELDASELRRQREGTPAPTGLPVLGEKATASPLPTGSPSSVQTEKSEGASEEKKSQPATTETKVDGAASKKD